MIKWLYDHYALTSLIALYYMVLLGYGTYMVFSQITEINPSGATAYAGLLGLPPAAIALIKWRLGKDNADKIPDE
tara:strand:- start:725 stop:949 length:225 start_codon:yes stop_codon:yes gene_type:complete